MEYALRVRDLDVPFGAARGLHGITFDVAAGECVAVVGASGAGKSTLLRAIAGLAPIAAGMVAVAGRDVTTDPPERRGVVYLHQSPVLFPHLDVAGNIAFPLRIRGMAKDAARERVGALLTQLRLDGLGGRRIAALSGGERHRVALARALAADPAVLLLDEPLSALDPALRAEVRTAVAAVRDRGDRGMLLVTHDLEDAARLAHRVCVLIDGRIAQDAAPAELFARPATVTVARALGVPNIIPGHVQDGLFTCALGSWATDRENGPASAVCWPEGIVADPCGTNVVVREIRHLPRQTTAVVEGTAGILEMAVDPLHEPVPGATLAVGMRPETAHVPRH